MQPPEKPKCPEHPNATVVSAKGVGRRDWLCLVCGKLLGEAPEQPDDHQRETMELKGRT
jgi:hypothetical protein